MRMIKTTAVAIGLLMSALAQAHPKLLSSTPAEGADGAAPSKIELHFSEKPRDPILRRQTGHDRNARHGPLAHADESQSLRRQ